MDEVVEDLPDDLLELPGPLVAERRKVLVDRVVIVLLGLDPRVGRVLDGGREVELRRDPGRGLGELVHRVGRVVLVEHTVLPGLCGVLDREAERLHRVLERDEPSALLALPVGGDREPEDGLGDEPVERRPPGLVKVEPGEELSVGDLWRSDAVDDALHHVGRGEPEDLGRVHDVARIEDLAPVVPRARLARERKDVLPTVIFHLERPLGDVGVGGPVLAHGPHLHEVGPGTGFAHRVEEVERPRQVLDLGRDRVVDVDHRVRRAPLLREVDDRVRLLAVEQVVHELVIADGAAVEANILTEDCVDRLLARRERRNRRGRPRADLLDATPRHEVVDTDHLVTPSEKMEGQRPARVPIDSGDDDLHGFASQSGNGPV